MKFIHAADIHLDSPLVGLTRYEGAPVDAIRGATRRAVENLVNLAISEEVAFVLIAGDLFDGDWKDYNTGLFFVAQMAKLRSANIPVFVVAGNHDAASQITKNLRMPDNVKTFSVRKPESVFLEDCGTAIHGQGFASRAVVENLTTAYPNAASGFFNIGLLHTSADGREGHEPYAPCSLDDLLAKGYQYWALGHVHAYEVMHPDPWVVFPGNTQGRHIHERGPKGCMLVTVEEGRVVAVERRPLDVLRWALMPIDVKGARTGDDVVDRVAREIGKIASAADDRAVAVRIELTGACKATGDLLAHPEHWTNQVRAVGADQSGGTVWIEKAHFRTRAPIDLDEIATREDAFGGLVRAVQGLDMDAEALAQLRDEVKDLEGKIPPELRLGPNPMRVDDADYLHDLLEEAQQLLLERVIASGDEP